MHYFWRGSALASNLRLFERWEQRSILGLVSEHQKNFTRGARKKARQKRGV
jgi:hypothetical protein